MHLFRIALGSNYTNLFANLHSNISPVVHFSPECVSLDEKLWIDTECLLMLSGPQEDLILVMLLVLFHIISKEATDAHTRKGRMRVGGRSGGGWRQEEF